MRFLKIIEWSLSTQKRKMLAPRVLAINALLHSLILLLLLQPSVLWLCIVTFNIVTGLVERASRLGGSLHVSCKRDQIKMRDYMDGRIIPPKRVTSPTWGSPPPCKQARYIVRATLSK